jgi:hypothetical protein
VKILANDEECKLEIFPKQSHALDLIQEAVGRAAQLGEPYECDLVEGFLKAKDTLGASAVASSQVALVLSAARMLITKVEKRTIALIIGDDPITGNQMSHLVRIRLICAELINLFTAVLENLKQTLQIRPRAAAR